VPTHGASILADVEVAVVDSSADVFLTLAPFSMNSRIAVPIGEPFRLGCAPLSTLYIVPGRLLTGPQLEDEAAFAGAWAERFTLPVQRASSQLLGAFPGEEKLRIRVSLRLPAV